MYDYCITPDNFSVKISWKADINSTIFNTTYMYNITFFSCNGSNNEIVKEYSLPLHNTSITTGNILAYNKSLLFEIEICKADNPNCITRPADTCVANILSIYQAGEGFG